MSQDNATKCSAADGVTQTFGFGHGTPIMVRAVDFNALYAEFQRLRMALAGLEKRASLHVYDGEYICHKCGIRQSLGVTGDGEF